MSVMGPVLTLMRSDGVLARVMRSSVWTVMGFGGGTVMRLALNLILTRLLFPEAFGLMALITVFIVGLTMFSDVGTHPSILQHKRGDDPAFLNTAFTIQVVRGGILWLAACALAAPLATFYSQPDLRVLLPVAAFSLLIHGFEPTRVNTAMRHMRVGRLTVLDLMSQAIGIVAIIGLAWLWQSVWALVVGGNLSALVRLAVMSLCLPGPKNRFQWDRTAANDLLHFGVWLFFSTICGFLVAQGDKAVLGKYLTLEQLGLYNIGYFLASFPLLLGQQVTGRTVIPLYRERPPAASRANFVAIRRMRFGLTAGLLALLAGMAFAGQMIVGWLYDPRYALAGSILVLIAIAQIANVIGMTYDQAALAAGDSRNFFWLTATRAVLQMTCLIVGAEHAGLAGALIGQVVASVAVYPAQVWLARRHGAWDPLHDAIFAGLGIAMAVGVVMAQQGGLAGLLALLQPTP